ncbi:hypothetical protein AciX9_3430 [Granulicella tundricola MP5ACTX9]|uniref:Uncharacterized protein n=1 Tax=Granulicella tundricola (strain ATCC BAA-1859 / DSM 23138 / MP5ACTX9) TaxID=1198114 RepID=E8X3D5_GRATM|nr:hypothetical protein AciX9_3430 [Granulicella tundricola MP5ACTX9]
MVVGTFLLWRYFELLFHRFTLVPAIQNETFFVRKAIWTALEPNLG